MKQNPSSPTAPAFLAWAVVGGAFALTASFAPQTAHAQTPVQLLTNGGFEAGSLAGWTTATQTSAGNTSGFSIADNTNSPGYSPNDPSTGYPFYTPATPVNDFPTVGAHSGNFYAVTDADGPAGNALVQSFTVPASATQVTLSFALFVNARDGAGAVNTNGNLDYSQALSKQFARVDLLSASAGAFSLGSGNMIQNFYLGADPNVGPNTLYPVPYRTYSFNLTGVALAGQTYKIRFADVGNRQVLNTGVDDVSVLAIVPSAGAPEPGSLPLVGMGLVAGTGAILGKRNKQSVRCGGLCRAGNYAEVVSHNSLF